MMDSICPSVCLSVVFNAPRDGCSSISLPDDDLTPLLGLVGAL